MGWLYVRLLFFSTDNIVTYTFWIDFHGCHTRFWCRAYRYMHYMEQSQQVGLHCGIYRRLCCWNHCMVGDYVDTQCWCHQCDCKLLIYYFFLNALSLIRYFGFQTSGGDFEMLAGNLASIGVGGIIATVTSLIVSCSLFFFFPAALS